MDSGNKDGFDSILAGFGIDVSLALMRHLYASCGWAVGTRAYDAVDFLALNLKVARLEALRSTRLSRSGFLGKHDRLQCLLEVFRTADKPGLTKRFPGSRVTFEQYKRDFFSLGLLGLVERARAPFRNSKLGFKEEGWMILSKIQHSENDEAYYQKKLSSKQITVDITAIRKIFLRWHAHEFRSQFKGDLEGLLRPIEQIEGSKAAPGVPAPVRALRLNLGFVAFLDELGQQPVPLANPGIFLFLPYLNRLRVLEKAAELLEIDPGQGYSWFSLLPLDMARIVVGISSISKASKSAELSFPLCAGLVVMPCADTILNGLAALDETALLELRRYLTRIALQYGLINGKRVALARRRRNAPRVLRGAPRGRLVWAAGHSVGIGAAIEAIEGS